MIGMKHYKELWITMQIFWCINHIWSMCDQLQANEKEAVGSSRRHVPYNNNSLRHVPHWLGQARPLGQSIFVAHTSAHWQCWARNKALLKNKNSPNQSQVQVEPGHVSKTTWISHTLTYCTDCRPWVVWVKQADLTSGHWLGTVQDHNIPGPSSLSRLSVCHLTHVTSPNRPGPPGAAQGHPPVMEKREMSWLHPAHEEKAKRAGYIQPMEKRKMGWLHPAHGEKRNELVASSPWRKEKRAGCIQPMEKRKTGWLHPAHGEKEKWAGCIQPMELKTIEKKKHGLVSRKEPPVAAAPGGASSSSSSSAA